jgi:hypothetical protein
MPLRQGRLLRSAWCVTRAVRRAGVTFPGDGDSSGAPRRRCPERSINDRIGFGVLSARVGRDLIEESSTAPGTGEAKPAAAHPHDDRVWIAMGLYLRQSYEEVIRRPVGNLGSWLAGHRLMAIDADLALRVLAIKLGDRSWHVTEHKLLHCLIPPTKRSQPSLH